LTSYRQATNLVRCLRISGPVPRPRRGRHLGLGLALTAALITTAAFAASTAAAAPAPKLDWRACQPAEPGFQCATARVPRNYSHPRRSKIHLAVIRHRATDPAHRIGTLFYNPGGPGGSGIMALPQSYQDDFFPPALRERFDLVSWDPRGVGVSTSTAVQCFASQTDETDFLDGVVSFGSSFPVGKAEKKKWIRHYRAFGHRCERTNGGLLRHVSTADTASDLNLLRRAVGDRRLSYWGTSYGTFLGATYANLFPSRVRALVLDGNINPGAWAHRRLKANGGSFLSTALRQHGDQGLAKTLDAFLNLCGRTDTAQCAFSAGSAAATRDKYDRLLRRLRTDPAADFTYAELTSEISVYLTSPAHWRHAADCLQRVLRKGSWCPTESPSTLPIPGAPPEVADQVADSGQPYAGPEQLLAILCSESPNPRPSAFWALDVFANERSGAAGRSKLWLTEPCASWRASAADRYAGPWDRRTANPLLVIGNTHDPNTPYRSSVAMSRQLARARLLTLAGYGHTSGNDPSVCIRRAVSAYLTDKVLPPEGTTCQPNKEPFGGTP
jgi:pimeloyl-ACP methyl ester carboxylesterase